MRPKRRRTRLRPAPFLVFLLVLNVAAGLAASKVTVLRHVRVDGCAPWDEPRVRIILERLNGKPCALINRYLVEGEVMQNPEVSSAFFDRNLFGSSVLNIRYRNPVARFYNHASMGLSSEGVIYRSEHLPSSLPTINLGDGRPIPILALAQDWPSSPIATVAIKAREIDTKNDIRIDYGSGASLCLNIGAGKVEFGTCDKLNEKFQALKAKLAEDPDYLSKISSLNLVVPTNPMTVPKKEGTNIDAVHKQTVPE